MDNSIKETQAELNVLLKMQKDFAKLSDKPIPTFSTDAPSKPRKSPRGKGTSLKDFQEDFLISDLQAIGDESEKEALNIDKWNQFLADSFDEEFGRIQAALGDDEVAKRLKVLRDEAKAIFEETRTPLEKFTAEIQKLKLLYEGGFFGEGAQAADLVGRAAEQSYARFVQSTKTTTDEITEFWVKAAHNMQDAMGDFFFDAMQGDLSDLAGSFKTTIDRMVADLLAAQASAKLFGPEFGKGGDLGGFVGELSKDVGGFFSGLFNADGNAFDGSGLIPFANGGIVSAATPFSFGGGKLGVMGEAGPEAILPLKRGSDGKLGVQAGGGMTVQGPLFVVNTPNADSFMRSESQVAASMQRALNRGRRVS